MTTRLVLVRHAQSQPSAEAPEPDWPLSELGRQQAQDLVKVLRELGVEGVTSSPYARAIATLAPFARAASLQIAIDPDLRERSLGGWLPDLEAVDDAIRRMHADLDFSLEGGETGAACLARFEAALQRVARSNPGACVAVGSHGGVLGHLLGRHGGDLPAEFWRRIGNPHLFFFDFDDDLCFVGERTLDGAAGIFGSSSAAL